MIDVGAATFSSLKLAERKLILFGGKGGVGKTTCASATAIHLADSGKETLILSTDPTPSLSDIFEERIGGEIKRIRGIKHLYALELNKEEVIRMWKERYGDEIYEVVSSFLPVGPEIVDYFANAPGIDEEFILAYILDLVEGGKYDTIILDTAPAGHTLSLLRLQSTFYSHLTDAAQLYVKLQAYLEKLRTMIGIKKKEREPLEIINEWKALANKVIDTLRNDKITDFITITIPEALGVYQTNRIISDLGEYGIKVRCIVINGVLPEEECTSDFFRCRFEMQSRYIREIFEGHGKERAITTVPLLAGECKGVEKLREIERFLFG
ncbi:MAG: ArsA family ATPase [Candidatus Methanospirareceae archaeon]